MASRILRLDQRFLSLGDYFAGKALEI